MQSETLSEIQKRGRFFSESFPGTKASDEWQRHREQLQETESTAEASTSNSSLALDVATDRRGRRGTNGAQRRST